MTEVERAYAELEDITSKLGPIEEHRKQLRERAADLVVELLKADEQPSRVRDRSPFSDAHVRTLARIAGLPPAKPGPRKAR